MLQIYNIYIISLCSSTIIYIFFSRAYFLLKFHATPRKNSKQINGDFGWRENKERKFLRIRRGKKIILKGN